MAMSIKDTFATFYSGLKNVFSTKEELKTGIAPINYGIMSGGIVSPQDTPDMTVKVSEVKGYFKSGEYFDIPAVSSLAIEKVSTDNSARIDRIYIASDKTIKILKGEEFSLGSVFKNTYTVNSLPNINSTVEFNGDNNEIILTSSDYDAGINTTETAKNIVAKLSSIYSSDEDLAISFSYSGNVITISETYPLGRSFKLNADFITAGTATISVVPIVPYQKIPTDSEYILSEIYVTSTDTKIENGGSYIKRFNINKPSYFEFSKIFKNISNQKKIIKNLYGNNIKDFGAIGDGITDDSAAFQLACNIGGVIFIPPGQYLLKNSIKITSDSIKFIGDTINSIILLDDSVKIETDYSPGHIIEINGITFDNKDKTKTNNNNSLININYAGSMGSSRFILKNSISHIIISTDAKINIIDNVIFYNSNIQSISGAEYIDISNTFIYGNGSANQYGIWIQMIKSDIAVCKINNCVIDGASYCGLRIDNNGKKGNIFINNTSVINNGNKAMMISASRVIMNNTCACCGILMPIGAISANFGSIVADSIILNNCYDLETNSFKTPNNNTVGTSISLTGNITLNNCRFRYLVDFTGVINGDYYDELTSLNILYKNSNKVVYGTAIPTTGTWAVGDKVYNTDNGKGKVIGWVCTVAGAPGAWITLGYNGILTFATESNMFATLPEYIGQLAMVSGDISTIYIGTALVPSKASWGKLAITAVKVQNSLNITYEGSGNVTVNGSAVTNNSSTEYDQGTSIALAATADPTYDLFDVTVTEGE